MQAYVLVQTEIGRAAQVIAEISKLDSVQRADGVTGPYDAIVLMEASSLDEVGRLVVHELQRIDGVTRTLTCAIGNLS